MADAQLRQWFSSIDTDKSGHLSAAELQRALALGNLEYSLGDVDSMLRAFDNDGTRTLAFEEFQKLHVFLVNVQASFQEFDVDKSGGLSATEVTAALKKAGFQIDGPAVAAMMDKFDNGSKKLGLDAFIRACLMLQTAARTFAAFDPNRTGTITSLTFSQFVYCVSHVHN